MLTIESLIVVVSFGLTRCSLVSKRKRHSIEPKHYAV